MGRNIFWRFAVAIFCAICFLTPMDSILYAMDISYELDWSVPELHITMSNVIPDSSINRPAALSEIQQKLIQNFSTAVLNVLQDILLVNSLYTFQDFVARNPDLIKNILLISANTPTLVTGATENMSQAWITNTIYLVPTISTILNRTESISLPYRLEWSPEAQRKTGIVIYAQDPLPVYGSDQKTYLKPSLFPEIMDNNLQSIFGPQFIEPEKLHEQALLAYTDSLDQESKFISRIGENPFRIVAYGIFGKYPCDLIISLQDAAVILANEKRNPLLTRGKILVLVASDTLVLKGERSD